ncbi:MAG: hypothetical protein ACXVRP_13315 [Solirubrobacteraceae bacterium]
MARWRAAGVVDAAGANGLAACPELVAALAEPSWGDDAALAAPVLDGELTAELAVAAVRAEARLAAA